MLLDHHDYSQKPASWLTPNWSSPLPRVLATMTTREGFGHRAFNLGQHVGDDAVTVAKHRAQLAAYMGAEVKWLRQVHGSRVVRLSYSMPDDDVEADGSFTTEPGLVCAVMVADCLPILLVAPQALGVAALHAGWRGLLGVDVQGGMQKHGVVTAGVNALCEATGCDPSDLQAWLGPCIGSGAFEVGDEVRQIAISTMTNNGGVATQEVEKHFRACPSKGEAVGNKWLANLPGLAQLQLARLGVGNISGASWCTVSEPTVFFSYRREGVTGRQAACISIAG